MKKAALKVLISDDLDFSSTKSPIKAQDDSDDEIVGNLHAKHKSSGDFPGTGFHIPR